jgi:hypothetical protein
MLIPIAWRIAMPRTRYNALLACALGALSAFNTAVAADTRQLESEARELVKAFSGKLKPQLKAALEEGGPTLAIEVCATQAPKIADTLAAQSGWAVGRVSLQARNASRAQPDSWEQSVLEEFDRRAAAGAEPPTLHRSEIRNGQFRYMQAQGVEGVCLLCHGETLSDEVRNTLEAYYPDDQATGYSIGQVRGAISLAKAL